VTAVHRFLLSVLVVWLVVPVGSGQEPGGRPRVQLFSGARIVQNGGGWQFADVIVRAGRIDRVMNRVSPAPGWDVISVAGKFMVPGFISAHSHVVGPTADDLYGKLGVYARYGITTVWSLGGEQEPAIALRDGQGIATLDRARLYVAGPVVTGASPEAARAAVARVAALKADIVKIRVDDNLGTGAKMPAAEGCQRGQSTRRSVRGTWAQRSTLNADTASVFLYRGTNR
jgi:hypothetical protein